MPRESKSAKQARAIEALERIDKIFPGTAILLNHKNVFELVIAVLMSAQTTDRQVNKVTPLLFEKFPTPYALADAPLHEIEDLIKSLGFFRTKALHVKESSQMIVSEFGGEVPHTMEELTRLPGVGRKTANIVLNTGFGIVEGIAVDTHVYRIAKRLRLTSAKTPGQAEFDLLKIIPQKYWSQLNHQWVQFGRAICDAKKPKCDECPLVDICPSAFLPNTTRASKKKA
ncbi:MAG: endonuclease III [Coriobacteriia bacterium]|nr:endonuclease III [Coriobacteriia bacterium]